MTLDAALAALAAAIAHRLVTAGYIATTEALAVDDADAVAPTGEETDFVTWAALTRGETRTVRTLLGRPGSRFVVEHRATLQLAWAGPDRPAGRLLHSQTLQAIATLPVEFPTLSGAVERFFLEEGSDEPLPPNGWGTTLVCAIRIRSSDPLGLTA
ncbi:hypothetical protein [Brevundimonas sp.]|uniref:hypothetical protein n=1 Tax=Brevundimonas sp. TaxID=1871086 RepID=UPI001A290079|nr:hypothetical protein [Brevundimonas sp.]MBJ7485960.1 hypothetical protein [Brevundimonas sp.]